MEDKNKEGWASVRRKASEKPTCVGWLLYKTRPNDSMLKLNFRVSRFLSSSFSSLTAADKAPLPKVQEQIQKFEELNRECI